MDNRHQTNIYVCAEVYPNGDCAWAFNYRSHIDQLWCRVTRRGDGRGVIRFNHTNWPQCKEITSQDIYERGIRRAMIAALHTLIKELEGSVPRDSYSSFLKIQAGDRIVNEDFQPERAFGICVYFQTCGAKAALPYPSFKDVESIELMHLFQQFHVIGYRKNGDMHDKRFVKIRDSMRFAYECQGADCPYQPNYFIPGNPNSIISDKAVRIYHFILQNWDLGFHLYDKDGKLYA